MMKKAMGILLMLIMALTAETTAASAPTEGSAQPMKMQKVQQMHAVQMIPDMEKETEVEKEPEDVLELVEYRQITDEELEECRYTYYLLAKLAMAEAEGESLEGKAAVVRVAMNRVESRAFPDTVEAVVFQRGQFSCIADGRWDAAEPNEDCYVAVQMVFEGWSNEIVEEATYFHSGDSGWHNRKLQQTGKIGRHTFYTEKCE